MSSGSWGLVSRGDPELSKGEIFEILQNERRRYVLQYFRQYEGPVSLGELANHVAAWEYRISLEDVTSEQRKRVYTTLQQTHLGRMEDAGIISYDQDNQQVQTTEQAENLTVYLEVVPGREFPWREFYLSIGAISCAVVAGLWVGLFPFWLLTPLEWATVIVTTFTGSAAYHTFDQGEKTLDDSLFPRNPDE